MAATCSGCDMAAQAGHRHDNSRFRSIPEDVLRYLQIRSTIPRKTLCSHPNKNNMASSFQVYCFPLSLHSHAVPKLRQCPLVALIIGGLSADTFAFSGVDFLTKFWRPPLLKTTIGLPCKNFNSSINHFFNLKYN